ncbi:hypothetical protein [Mucilaginibacter boryungensis]|uniref:Secreted protein n=1 Tax=Mucilaginibacter boryungensis TaxID=768480 RepID=A0ABR9XFI7_9SPHI|nr:hypothetical protein [Mucilaginibacter boryungensis]MBE9666031.1 hypothetical protein [Mucilaginibacter boryungensis]
MYKALSTIISLTYMCCLPKTSKAQFNILVAGKNFHINSFKDNKIYPGTSRFVIDSVMPPISQSKYDLEIRYTLSSNWGGLDEHCIVIKGNRDSLEAIYYFEHNFSKTDLQGKLKDSVKILHRYDRISAVNQRGVYVKPLKPSTSLDKLVKLLLAYHICDTPNDYEVVEHLTKKGKAPKEIPCMDCVDFTFYEVKIAGHFRSFFVSNRYQDYNRNIPEFNDQRQIDEVFHTLVPDIKK